MGTLLTVTALVTDSGTNRRAISLCVLKFTPNDSGVRTDVGRPGVTAPRFQPGATALVRPRLGGRGPEQGVPHEGRCSIGRSGGATASYTGN